MKIISHRGYWKSPSDKNTSVAFKLSFSLGFGTETDLRDQNSRIVISHDMPIFDAMPLEIFFDIYKNFPGSLPLALNIKADGLQTELMKLINAYEIENYFVFDMSVPDGLLYIQKKFQTYTRQSEYEKDPPFYELAKGVWIDEFHNHWIKNDEITKHINNGKSVSIVSPELHNRPYLEVWQQYKCLEEEIGKDKFMICTDFPELAQSYFNE